MREWKFLLKAVKDSGEDQNDEIWMGASSSSFLLKVFFLKMSLMNYLPCTRSNKLFKP